jgi:PilZ domain-containing protein
MSALQREAVGMPAAGARLTLATMLGAADALVIESVDADVTVLSDGCGLHKGAKANTRIYDGERVWHLTFAVRERHELRPGQARVALALSDRSLLGEERRLPRVTCQLAATARRAGTDGASSWATVLDVSQDGLALRTGVPYGAGDLIDVDLDDGTGAVINARLEVVDLIAEDAGGIARARIVAVGDDGAQRLCALVDRLRNSPSDPESEAEPLPALREALAAARRRAA